MLLLLPHASEDEEALELCVEGKRVCPSYGHGHYGVVPPRASDIVAIYVL